MKYIKHIFLITFIVISNCSVKKPVENKIENGDLLKENSFKKEGKGTMAEIYMENCSGGNVTFSYNAEGSVWGSNFNFTSSYHSATSSQISNGTSWDLNHINLSAPGQADEDFAYAIYEFTVSGSNKYLIVNYLDDHYDYDDPNYESVDIVLIWKNSNWYYHLSGNDTTYCSNSTLTIWDLLSKGTRSVEDFVKLQIDITGTDPLYYGDTGYYDANPLYFYSFDSSTWWVRADGDGEKGETKGEPIDENWQELEQFKDEVEIEYQNNVDFWLKCEVVDDHENSEIDSFLVHTMEEPPKK